MTKTAIKTSTIAAEDFQIGRRYWEVRPGFESNWTIAKVELHTSQGEVYRDGKWIAPELVTVTRRDGRSQTFEVGQQVAIQGPFRD